MSRGGATAEELDLLEKFRENIQDLPLREDETTDEALLKWLRARELSIDAATDMLRKASQWRISNDIYNILNWKPPTRFWKEFYYEICGHTSTGCPVVTVHFGNWDIRRVAESSQRDLWLKYIDLLFAKLDDRMKKYSQDRKRDSNNSNCSGSSDDDYVVESQFIAIADFNGFSMRQFTSYSCLNTIRELAKRYEANYPETLKTCYIVNASRVFQMLYKVIKPMLTARTVAKINIYGSNEAEWKAALLENIPANQLSASFGGTYVPPVDEEPDDHRVTGKYYTDLIEEDGDYL